MILSFRIENCILWRYIYSMKGGIYTPLRKYSSRLQKIGHDTRDYIYKVLLLYTNTGLYIIPSFIIHYFGSLNPISQWRKEDIYLLSFGVKKKKKVSS